MTTGCWRSARDVGVGYIPICGVGLRPIWLPVTAIGVYPVGGWWKEKPYLERVDARARYSLLVTIRVPGTDIDIYTPVEAQIAIPDRGLMVSARGRPGHAGTGVRAGSPEWPHQEAQKGMSSSLGRGATGCLALRRPKLVHMRSKP